MKQKLYAKIAGLLNARQNCLKFDNKEWYDKHTGTIEELVRKYMPHGSGIDAEMILDFNRSNENKLVFAFSYHFMDENGYYDGWESYSLIVTASLLNGFNMRFIGKNRDDIKDYFYQTFEYYLNAEVE